MTPDFETIEWMNGSMWFVCREAIDAGEAERALSVVRAQAPPTPFGQAVLAVIEGAVSGDDERWHEALRLAAEKGLRPIAVDASRASPWVRGAARTGRTAYDCSLPRTDCATRPATGGASASSGRSSSRLGQLPSPRSARRCGGSP